MEKPGMFTPETSKRPNPAECKQTERADMIHVTYVYCYVIVGVTSLVCYVNNVYGDFVHDDVRAVIGNPDVRGDNSLMEVFSNDFWGKPMSDVTSHKSYRPLCVLSFRLNHLLHPGNVFGYHVTNNILHGVATVLFTHLCRVVIFSGDVKASLTAGLLFAVHPIHTEAVSGIVGRAEVMSCIFFLLSLAAYQRLCQTRTRSRLLLMLTVVCAALALLCKEQGITVLGVCLGFEVLLRWHSHRMNGTNGIKNGSGLSASTYRMLTLTVSSIILILLRLSILGGSFPKFHEEDNPASFSRHLLTRTLTYTYLWAFNYWLILCPINLSHDWQMGSIPLVETLWDIRNIATLFAVVLMVLLALTTLFSKKVTHTRRIFFGLALSIMPFLLASNIFVRVGFVLAERILYMPSMGVIVLVTTGIDVIRQNMPSHCRQIQTLVVIFGVVIPACRTLTRNQVWLSRENLARSGLQVLQDNAKMHYNYANLLAEKGNLSEAVTHYQKAISLWPNYVSAHNNLAHYMANKSEALIHLTEVIRIQPCHANAYTNIANIYHSVYNKTEEAIKLLSLAIKCEAKNPSPHLSMAVIYQQLNDTVSAERHYSTAMELAPSEARVYYNIGLYHEKRDNYQLAADYLQKAISLNPDDLSNLHALARVYRHLREHQKAEELFIRILKIKRDQSTLDMIGSFYYNAGNIRMALEIFEEAYSLGNSETVALHLAQVLIATERYDEAESLLKKHISHQYQQTALIMQLANIFGLKKEHSKAVSLLMELKQRRQRDLSVKQLSAIHHQIGNHLKDTGKLHYAFKNYKEAVRLDADNAESHHNLAVYYHKQGAYQEALCHYQSAIKLKPEDELLRTNYRSFLEKYRAKTRQYETTTSERGPSQSSANITKPAASINYGAVERNTSDMSVDGINVYTEAEIREDVNNLAQAWDVKTCIRNDTP